jgi:hypothetical protein
MRVVVATSASLTPYEHPLVGVEEWLDLSGHVSLLSYFDWLHVKAYRT